MRRALVIASLGLVLLAGCPKPGGSYAQGDRPVGDVDRGETQGRMFDMVSNMPDGDDWQIRIRGSSLWASYSDEDSSEELPSRNLTSKETSRVWTLIDAVEIPERKKGKKDEDEGYVQFRLREPGGEDDEYEFFTIYVSREGANDDEEVSALAEYLVELLFKYHKKKPEF